MNIKHNKNFDFCNISATIFVTMHPIHAEAVY